MASYGFLGLLGGLGQAAQTVGSALFSEGIDRRRYGLAIENRRIMSREAFPRALCYEQVTGMLRASYFSQHSGIMLARRVQGFKGLDRSGSHAHAFSVIAIQK